MPVDSKYAPSAVTIQLVLSLALTLTLSPRRGDHPLPRWEQSPNGGQYPALEKLLPLLGERVGVREDVASLLNSHG
jgi:hypothetical protein